MTAEAELEFSKEVQVQVVEDRIEDGYVLGRTSESPPVEVAVLHDGAAHSLETAEQVASLLGAAGVIRELLNEATDAWAAQFDAGAPVSGADLLEWFALWRVAAQDALETLPEAV